MSIGVASVQQKEFITASAVYYREQRFCGRERCSSSSRRPSILAQCLASTNLEQYLSSGTVSDIRNLWNNNGLTLDINRQLSLSAGTQPYLSIITIEYTCICVHIILQCPLQISNISITKDDGELLSNKYNSAAQMFQMSIKVECCNKDVEQFFSSLAVGRNFNFYSHFL